MNIKSRSDTSLDCYIASAHTCGFTIAFICYLIFFIIGIVAERMDLIEN